MYIGDAEGYIHGMASLDHLLITMVTLSPFFERLNNTFLRGTMSTATLGHYARFSMKREE